MMLSPEIRVWLLMASAVLVGTLLGALLIHKGWRRVYGAVMAGHLFAAVGFFFAARQGQGMDGLGHAIMLAVFVIPSLLGMVLGGTVIWWRARGR